MLAASYARYSSDAQRDVSIEIQLSEIAGLIERMGWERGPVYTDYAVSGRREDRPSFNRALEDAEAGAYEALVVYKADRFARNVAYAQEAKRRLFAAGVRLFSVREGEITDTPEGFLMGGMSDLFAEYYSRNLSVMVRNGMRKSAQGLRAAGRRMYGYRPGPGGDAFEVVEDEAETVCMIYRWFLGGLSANSIAVRLESQGRRTRKGNPFSRQYVMKIIGNPAYKGVYRYNGVDVAGGMPAIVDEGMWDAANALRGRRSAAKRRKGVEEYPLSDKVWCLSCGGRMCGTSGTGKSGRKYRYYGCVEKGGCGMHVPAGKVEGLVYGVLAETFSDPSVIEIVAADMTEYANSLPDNSENLRQELADARSRRDRLVEAIAADGVPASSVAEAISGCERRVRELERMISEDEAQRGDLLDVEGARQFVEGMIAGAETDEEFAKIISDTFVDRVYIDKERAVIVLALGDEPGEYPLEEMRRIADGGDTDKPIRAFDLGKQKEHPGKRGVLEWKPWWTVGDSNPGPWD